LLLVLVSEAIDPGGTGGAEAMAGGSRRRTTARCCTHLEARVNAP
jgi:hypothetical protein